VLCSAVLCSAVQCSAVHPPSEVVTAMKKDAAWMRMIFFPPQLKALAST
jgi:hypothetical protein